MSRIRIPFLDLTPGEDAEAVREAIDRVIASGWFILGPEVEAFESEFAATMGGRHVVGVANGTDALALILRAIGVGRGEEVIVPALTAAYTGLAVIMAGATPVFADVDPERLTMDPASCTDCITSRSAAILPVHLYGQAADLGALRPIAERHGVALIEDCCQAHLATCDGVPVGTVGAAGAFSFYPTKNLAALGDAGAVLTDDAALADRVRRLRNGGQTGRYHHQDAGVNSRLDELQAAVLRARLPLVRAWTERRRELARRYRQLLENAPVRVIPQRDPGHVYHLFPIRHEQRDALQAHLRAAGVDTLVHYPVPLTNQPAFAGYPHRMCAAAQRAARELLSLPLYPRMRDEDVVMVAEAVSQAKKGLTLA